MRQGRVAGGVACVFAGILLLALIFFPAYKVDAATQPVPTVASEGAKGSTVSLARKPVVSERSWIDRQVDLLSDQRLLNEDPHTLEEPVRAAAAERIAAQRRPLFFLWAACQILFSFRFWRSGNAARLRDLIAVRIKNVTALRAVYLVCLQIFLSIVAFPAQYVSYRLLVDVGISKEPFASWMQSFLIATSLQMAGATVLVLIILALVDRTKLWYLWSSFLVMVGSAVLLVAVPLFVTPLFYHLKPVLPNSTLGRHIAPIVVKAGVGPVAIFVSNLSRTSEVGNANVAGVGPTRRIVIGDTLLKAATPREVKFVLAHELGHLVHNDTIWLTVCSVVILLAAAAFAVLTAEQFRLRPDDDALSRLALVAAFLGVYLLVLFPIGNAYSRYVEARADEFAVHIEGDRAAGARVFVRFADDGFSPMCPPSAVRLYFYDHPPLGTRISALQNHEDACP